MKPLRKPFVALRFQIPHYGDTMLTSLRIAFLLLAIPAVLNAQQIITDAAPVPFNSAVKVTKSKNGIPFYYLNNAKPAKRLDLILTVNAGAVLEDIDQHGLAHFCEHMAFNGTKEFPKQELVSFLESTGIRFGADLNAYTNFDETVYMLTIPVDSPETLIKGVKVMRDWAAYVNYTTEDINEERGVVTEEWRLHKGAQERIGEIQRPVIFNNSAYATHDVIGDTATLLHCDPNALRRFYKKWYTPANMSLIAVGDVEYGTIHDIVMKYFYIANETGSEGTPRPTITIPDNNELQISIASDPELQVASFTYMIRRPSDTIHTYGEYRKQLADQLASSMLNSRLGELTQKATPPFARALVGKSRLAREHVALYSNTIAAGKNVMVSANALLTEIERVRKHGFTATELKRAQDQLLAQMEEYYNERNTTESQGLAMELMRHVLQAESVPGITHEVEIYRHYVPQITTEECKNVFNSAFTDKNRVILISVPEAEGYTKPTEKQVRDLLMAVSTKALEPYEDNVPLAPLMASAPTPGSVKNTKEETEVGAKVLTLSNGARVILKKTDFKADEVMFRAEAYGGQSLGDAKDHFTLSNAAELVDASGISTFDTPTLTKMLAGKNLTISPFIGMEQQGLSGSSTPKDLKTLFELVYLYFTQPRMDNEAVASWKTKTKAMLDNKASNPQAALFDTLATVMTQYNIRSMPMQAADVDKIDTQKALEFYKKLFSNAGNFTFTIVGNYNEAEIETLINTYIASLPSAPSKTTWKDAGIRTAKGKIDKTIYKGSDSKSFVVLDYSGAMKYDPQHRYDAYALTEVMTIRLREKLREQASGVYFVQVQPQLEKIPEPYYNMIIVFTCNPDRVDELVNMANLELDTLAMKTVDDSYITKVREIQSHEREVASKTNQFWLRGLSAVAMEGEPFAVINQRNEMIKNLSANQVLKAAKTYLETDNYARFVLKPEQK